MGHLLLGHRLRRQARPGRPPSGRRAEADAVREVQGKELSASPAKPGRCRRHTPTEGSWASSLALMTPPSASRTPPLRGIREGEEAYRLVQPSRLAAPGGTSPLTRASTWRTVSNAWLSLAGGVRPPICGVAMTLGRRASSGDGI